MSRKKQWILVTASAAGLLLVAPRLRADSACIPDVQRYCSAIPIGEGRVLTCLQARWRDLASACQQEIQQIQNRANEVTSACTGDVWQYCGNVAPGGDRIRVCLWSHWNDLSSTCRDKAAAVAEKAQSVSENCADDIPLVCPGMQPGGGRIYLCLKALESRVSARCRAVLR